jgi:hypothetical protein
MKILGFRYCSVSPHAAAQADFFDKLGMPRMPIPDFGIAVDGFGGAIFPAGASWLELWPVGPQMPEGVMLQIVVDDVEAFAARGKGLEATGPQDAHGERIYFLKAPGGLSISIQSALAGSG